jgi:hypothetical protein
MQKKTLPFRLWWIIVRRGWYGWSRTDEPPRKIHTGDYSGQREVVNGKKRKIFSYGRDIFMV